MAIKYPSYKTFSIKPIDGQLDTRLTPDEVSVGGYRWRESWESLQKGKVCRMSGWKHGLADDYNNNADLHDQLLSLAGGGHIRQPFILGFEAVTTVGLNKLFWATQNRIYALNNSTGNYKIISDLLGGTPASGCPEHSWWGASMNDIAVFTNNLDKPVMHVIDQPEAGPDNQSVSLIDDLERLNISAVSFVIAWGGLMFYCNVVQDGTRHSYRVRWSDYQNPVSVVPLSTVDSAGVTQLISLAGYKDFDFGEVVLNAAPLGNSLFFYTNTGIWECAKATDNVSVLSFTRRYHATRPGHKCLAFPKTLISTGSDHWFMAGDGIYQYNYYVPEPQRLDWVHRASSIIFDDINLSRCQGHCAGYETAKKQLFFFWAKSGQDCPQQGFCINTETQFISSVPFGATACCNFGPNQQQAVRDFMVANCVCTPAEMASTGFVKEGGYCVAPAAPTCTPPTCMFTTQTLDIDGVLIEDYTSSSDDPNSLCAKLAAQGLSNLCASEFTADQCKPVDSFLFASSDDWCIKETDPAVYYREVCIGFSGCGDYVRKGYRSPLRSGPMDLGLPEREKWMVGFEIEAYPGQQTIPSSVFLRVGGASQALDPNLDMPGCMINWDDQPLKELECLSPAGAENDSARTWRPDESYAWPIYIVGRFLFFELDVVNPTATPEVDTGGAVCLSRISFDVEMVV